MAGKRAMGELEHEIMSYLWATSLAATPAEVHAAVAPDLAYTTVMTVLTRLWAKEQLTREPRGRGFAYRTVNSEAEHRAQQMQVTLNDSRDRDGVLSSFVETLSAQDAEELRRLLSGNGS